MEQNFEKLEELIKDNDKIVTVAYFAYEANISIQDSKKTIEKFVEINKDSGKLYITYILNGKKKSEQKISVSLVKYTDLHDEKKLYDVDLKEVVFSIQRAKHIDYNIIALVKSEESENPNLGVIVGKNCTKRVLRKKVLPTLPVATVRGKSTIFNKLNNAKSKENADKDDEELSSKNKVQGGIANLFNKAPPKNPDFEGEKLEKKSKKTNGNFEKFFTKSARKESITNDQKEVIKEKNKGNNVKQETTLHEKEKISEKDYSSKKETKQEIMAVDEDVEIIEDSPKKEKNCKQKNSQRKRRANNDDTRAKSAKKRRRIIIENDSDSDDIFQFDKEKEVVTEPSDEDPEPEPSKMETKTLVPKNKRRKAVEKTYKDDEGFIVTQTEYVYETASEDENEPGNKIAGIEKRPENPKTNSMEKKNSSHSENEISPKKGAKGKRGTKKTVGANQPTLMNFFKKK